MPRILDIGCGLHKLEGAIGLDMNPRTAADVLYDLNRVPYPFVDDAFDEVVGRHVIEHVENVLGVMAELHRITRPGGIIRVLAPHYTNPDWPTDPTHRVHLNSFSFRCFTDEEPLFPFYTTVRLKPRRVHVTVLRLWKYLGWEWLINLDARWPALRFLRRFWEHYLSFIIRGKEILFEFEVVKSQRGGDEAPLCDPRDRVAPPERS
jgi:SAM-dependent methyltransferase